MQGDAEGANAAPRGEAQSALSFESEAVGQAAPEPVAIHDESPASPPAPHPVETAHAAVEEPPVVTTPLPHAPQVIASFAPPPATFQVVSQHEDTVEASRPVRRRPRAPAPPSGEPLQLVETAAEKAASVPPVLEDEPPRRTKPRRRRVVEVPNEPLQLVETQPGEGAPPQA